MLTQSFQSQPDVLPPAQETVQVPRLGAINRLGDESRRTSQGQSIQSTKKKIVRPPKYHETKMFLHKESNVLPHIEIPSHLGYRAAECYRLAATFDRIIERSALRVRPVSWGYGTRDGTLGHGNAEHVVQDFKRVAAFRRDHLSQVSAGDKLSLFLTDAGRVLESGRLHLHQDGVKMWLPQEVSFSIHDSCDADGSSPSNVSESGVAIEIVQVEAGHLAAYAVDSQGRVFAWGTRRYGQLGLGEDNVGKFAALNADTKSHYGNQENNKTNEEDDEDTQTETRLRRHDPVELVPRLVQSPSLNGAQVSKLSAGNHFVLAMSSSGYVFSWGWNWHGQLGLGESVVRESVPSPQPVTSGLEALVAVDISAGHSHSLIVAVPRGDPTNQASSFLSYTLVLSFGLGRKGRLGVGGEVDRAEPKEVAFFRGLHATRVAAGHDHSLVLCAVDSINYIYAFGGNEFGQLGIAQTTTSWSDMPMLIDELSGVTIASVGAGAYVSSALSGDGEVYTWGDGSHGKTARADKRTTFMPWKVPTQTHSFTDDICPTNKKSNHRVVLDTEGFVTQLSMGAHHSIALYRIEGKPDRWRKFPMGEVAPFLHLNEGAGSKSVKVVCASSHVHLPVAPFGIMVHCETCSLGPLCRVCSRRCHHGHTLLPRQRVLGDCKLAAPAGSVACACGSRRPPPPPPQQPQSPGPRKPAFKVGTVTHSSSAAVDHPPLQPISANEPTGPVYCSMASLPVPVPEDSLLR